MVNCSKCGYNNVTKATTCASCGEPISVVVKNLSANPWVEEVAMNRKTLASYALFHVRFFDNVLGVRRPLA